MERMRIAAIFADQESLGGKDVTVCGWARTIRDMKTFGFIELNDGSCFKNLQVVMSAEELANYKDIAAQNVGAALIVKGTVVLTPDAKQPLEVKAHSIEVEGKSTPDYPLQKKRHSVEFLRTIQHLRPRTNLFSATFRVRSAAAYAVHEFFQSRGFVYVQTPIITGSDCEGAGEMFQVTTLDLNNVPKTEDGQVDYTQDFFGKKTSLTVSGQLNAENFAMAFGDVYTFGPTFRAENSNTQRHAAEFWMIEPEMAFCDLAGDMDVAEAMIKHIIRRVLERCPDEIDFFNSFVDKGLKERLEHVMTSDFGRVSYTDAVEILKKNNPCRLNHPKIGEVLASSCNDVKGALPYLSAALLDLTVTHMQIVMGYLNLYCKQRDYENALLLLDWALAFYPGLKCPQKRSYLDKSEAALWAVRADVLWRLEQKEDAADSLRKAKVAATAFDREPNYDARNIRFVSAAEAATAYDDMGSTAMDVIDTILADSDEPMLLTRWMRIQNEE